MIVPSKLARSNHDAAENCGFAASLLASIQNEDTLEGVFFEEYESITEA